MISLSGYSKENDQRTENDGKVVPVAEARLQLLEVRLAVNGTITDICRNSITVHTYYNGVSDHTTFSGSDEEMHFLLLCCVHYLLLQDARGVVLGYNASRDVQRMIRCMSASPHYNAIASSEMCEGWSVKQAVLLALGVEDIDDIARLSDMRLHNVFAAIDIAHETRRTFLDVLTQFD